MEEITEKIKAALEYLRMHEPVHLEGLRLENNPLIFNVIGWSEFSNFKQLNKAQSLKELEGVKHFFYSIINISDEFSSFVNGKNIEFHLYFDDYGKGSIAICSERNNIVEWQINLEN